MLSLSKQIREIRELFIESQADIDNRARKASEEYFTYKSQHANRMQLIPRAVSKRHKGALIRQMQDAAADMNRAAQKHKELTGRHPEGNKSKEPYACQYCGQIGGH